MSEQEIMLQNAQNLMSQGEYEEGVKLLRQLGDYPEALRLLGVAYYYGDGVEEDHNKALEYYVAAYEHEKKDLFSPKNWLNPNDWGLSETIHELVQENLRRFRENQCDFKDEIGSSNKMLKENLDFIAKTHGPYDESTQLLISMQFTTAFKHCCDILRVFLNHHGNNTELPLRSLFLEGMKLGLAELEFITHVLACHNKITEEGDYSITNQFIFSASISTMRTFMENVEIVINNKTDKELLKEILSDAARNK